MFSLTSRFREVTDGAYAIPGVCLICRSSKSNMMDVDADFDYWGAVYICRDCVLEMAEKYGALSPERAKKLTDNLLKVEKILEAQTDRVISLQKVIDGFRAFVSINQPGSDNPASDSANGPSATESRTEKSTEVVVGDKQRVSPGDSSHAPEYSGGTSEGDRKPKIYQYEIPSRSDGERSNDNKRDSSESGLDELDF